MTIVETSAPQKAREREEQEVRHEVPGPGSLTWRLFGDRRLGLLMLWSGTLQAMHPVLSRALIEHSDTYDNELSRLVRSGQQIHDTVFDLDGETSRRIREMHRSIQGTMPSGKQYHALNPEAYYWAHATFFYMQVVLARTFDKPLTRSEQEELYEESKGWYARYGLSTRVVPETYDDFLVYFEDVVQNVLECTEAAMRAASPNGYNSPRPFEDMSRGKWVVVEGLVVPLLAWVARGTLPPVVRQRMGWSWSRRDQVLLRGFGLAMRGLFAVLPAQKRLNEEAYQAYLAAGLKP